MRQYNTWCLWSWTKLNSAHRIHMHIHFLSSREWVCPSCCWYHSRYPACCILLQHSELLSSLRLLFLSLTKLKVWEVWLGVKKVDFPHGRANRVDRVKKKSRFKNEWNVFVTSVLHHLFFLFSQFSLSHWLKTDVYLPCQNLFFFIIQKNPF